MDEKDRADLCWYCGGKLVKDSEQHYEEGEYEEWPCTEVVLHCEDCGANIKFTKPDEPEEKFPEGENGLLCPDDEEVRDRCVFCNCRLIWQNDFDYSDVYGEGEGIVTYLAPT